MSDVTSILEAAAQGDPHAAEKLLPLVYEELRKLAAARLAQEKPGQTLQATALVHEAYLRLVGDEKGLRESSVRADESAPDKPSPAPSPQPLAPPAWNSRGHFFGAAAEAMRRILVEQARRKQATKRGGDQQRIDLVDVPGKEAGSRVDLLALDQALTELAAVDATAAELVKLRYFAGLSSADADRTWASRPELPTGPGFTLEPGCVTSSTRSE